MKDLISCCGLDCETCEARIATQNDDQALREKVAKEWTEMNQVEITPDMINCDGCRVDGRKTPFCNSMCEIRQCVMGKKYGTCGDCAQMETCETVASIHGHNEDAKKNLLP
ncbi:MAG: DUF3795 domain-containing protein [bacterium]|nr:DUF3795 domain-containing protein [bacterium]